MRVAPVPEAHQLLAALPDDVAMPYAIAIGAGLRRSELRLLDWSDVLWDANKVLVRDSKSEAGLLRRAPVSKLGSAKAMAPRENEELAAQLARVVKGLAGTLRTSASSRAASTRRSSPRAASCPLCGRSRGGPRSR